MSVIDELIEVGGGIDISTLIAHDVETMEEPFVGSELFKYYGRERREFFDKPRVRFTQRTSLNDPFELTKRWKQFWPTQTSSIFKDTIRRSLVSFASDPALIRRALLEHIVENGIVLDETQERKLDQFLGTGTAELFVQEQLRNLLPAMESFLDYLFSEENSEWDLSLERATSELGIFSLSETAVSDRMWGLYASAGSGFVVGFDPSHEFFRRAGDGNVKTENLLRKVKYTSSVIHEFVSNPYFLFLVKDAEWVFEREWRMIRRLQDSDLVVQEQEGDPVHLFDVQVGMIKSVIFGYKYPENIAVEHQAALLSFDPSVQFFRARLNSELRQIDLVDCPIQRIP